MANQPSAQEMQGTRSLFGPSGLVYVYPYLIPPASHSEFTTSTLAWEEVYGESAQRIPEKRCRGGTSLDPSEWSPVEILANANVAYSQGRLNEALILYRRALEIQPDQALAHARVGGILAQQGDLHGAQAAIKTSLRLDERLAAAHNNLGNVHYTQGNFSEAVTCYARAIALEPDNPIFHDNLHAAHKKLGNISKAISAYKRARIIEQQHARNEATALTARLRSAFPYITYLFLVAASALLLVMCNR